MLDCPMAQQTLAVEAHARSYMLSSAIFKLPNQLVSSLHGGMGSLNTQVQGLYVRGSVVQKEPAGPDLAGAGSSAQQLGTLPLRM